MSDLISAEKSKLYAILLTDTFTSAFSPLTRQHPISTFPLCNIPLIQYNIDYLLSGGVDELILPITSHKNELNKFIQSRYSHNPRIRPINCPNSTCTGDVLRHIESMQLIKANFVLMRCTTITNIDLHKAVQQHKANMKADKFTFSTLVFAATHNAPRTVPRRRLTDDTVVWTTGPNAQIVHLDNNLSEHHTIVDSELITDKMTTYHTVDIRYDLLDTCVDICAADVLAEYRDNFDYNDVRADFVRGVLSNAALGNSLYAYIAPSAYACDITDWRQYHTVSQHILQRYMLVYAPDVNLLNGSSDVNYVYSNGVYQSADDNLSVGKSTQLSNHCMFGRNVSVGDNTVVQRSIIGHNVKIGQNCKIVDSYVWSNVTIQDNVTITNAVVADNTNVHSNATIGNGSIVSYGVTVGSKFVVKPYSLVTTVQRESDTFSDDDTDTDTKHAGEKFAELGEDSNGRVYDLTAEDDGDDEDSELQLTKYKLQSMVPDQLGFTQMLHASVDTESVDELDEADLMDDDDIDVMSDGGQVIESNDANNIGNATMAATHTVDPLQQHINEVTETIARGSGEKLDMDGIVLEMASLKLSRDMSTEEYAHAAFRGILNLVYPISKVTGQQPVAANKQLTVALGQTLKHWSAVLAKYCRLESDQLIFIYGLEDACLDHDSAYSKLFAPTLQLLYDVCELISEEAILIWDEQRQNHKHEPQHKLWESTSEFLQWLKSASEDEDDDDSEDD